MDLDSLLKLYINDEYSFFSFFGSVGKCRDYIINSNGKTKEAFELLLDKPTNEKEEELNFKRYDVIIETLSSVNRDDLYIIANKEQFLSDIFIKQLQKKALDSGVCLLFREELKKNKMLKVDSCSKLFMSNPTYDDVMSVDEDCAKKIRLLIIAGYNPDFLTNYKERLIKIIPVGSPILLKEWLSEQF